MKSIVPPLIKLITFAVITVIATAMLALTIANAGSSGKHDFQAIFDDAAMLNKGDDVRIAGVRVGAVSNVEVFDRNRAKVSFAVDRDTLPDGTNVHIRYKNLTGLRYLALERGAGDAGKVLRPGHVFGLDGGGFGPGGRRAGAGVAVQVDIEQGRGGVRGAARDGGAGDDRLLVAQAADHALPPLGDRGRLAGGEGLDLASP